MKRTAAALTTIVVITLASACSAYSQEHGGHENLPAHHDGPNLFLAQLSGAETVPASGSAAVGTGAFSVDFQTGSALYDLTYHGLEHGVPQRIALYNFDRGANGVAVFVLCGGAGAPACPSGVSGNLTGTWDFARTLEGRRRSELTGARIYAEITGGDGKPEIRGQLEPNNAMLPVRNFVAHLTPVGDPGARGVGTAIMSEVHYADGRVSVFYHATVAGTSSAPVNAALVPMPPRSAATTNAAPRQLPAIERRNALPQMRVLNTRAAATTGGALTGIYESRRDAAEEPMTATKATAGGGEAGITVSTARFPNGELFGVLVPVNR
jgi:hypothetical protein